MKELKPYKNFTLNILFLIIVLLSYSINPHANGSAQWPAGGGISSNVAEIGWHLRKIDMERAWEITKGSKDIIVAVLDSGIDFSHPELVNASWINSGEIANNTIDDDNNGFIDDVNGWDFVSNDNNPGPEETDPIHWHATFIAGVIAAPLNDVGVVGVAPNVTVMDVRVLDQFNMQGTTLAGLGDAIRYAVDNGADVISMSLQNYANSSYYYDDIQYAITQNVVLVSITGNNWVSYGGGLEIISLPGAFEEVIAVGATNYYNLKADYSNYGEWTEIVAPVGDENTGIRSTWPPDTYDNGWGTSFACPQVAGVVALIKSLNNTLSVSRIREILHKTAVDLGDPGKDNYFGYGLLNATAALLETINPQTDEDKGNNLVIIIVVPIASVLLVSVVVVVIILVRRKIIRA